MINNYNGFDMLSDGRTYLAEHTIIDLSERGGGCYRITGKPVGYGSMGIIYPAVSMVRDDGTWEDGTLHVAIKEFFPASFSSSYGRMPSGEIKALGRADESLYELGSRMFRTEREVTGKISARGFRLTPILLCADELKIRIPGRDEETIRNVFEVQERLDEKGSVLADILKERLSGWQCFHLFGLVLRALKEVHTAGFLHGDIQEHNIFVKGWEEDERSCEVSLIDFSSARVLLQDGATDVIEDGGLFSTEGYAAPEYMNNGGKDLRLTPAADLYAAGVLLFRMLNGSLPKALHSDLSRNEAYLREDMAKSARIPSGAVLKINEFLSGLLMENPKERYQSAGEALMICERIENALSPRTSALEATDYAAFISYRHEQPAVFIADRIQKKLEGYRIPDSIRKKDGQMTLGKVFRDQTELTAGGDLAHNIQSALSHSEYLIVILSPGVKRTVWVESEIRMFLETHSRDKILTVLAEGEPADVTPDILLGYEKEADGTVEKVISESLAADMRGKNNRERSRKIETEIYRLIAPMIGCGFDDLVQRQKAYRQKVMFRAVSAAFVLTLCILGVIGALSYRIYQDYMDSLTRESVTLAEQSGQAYDQGEKKEAIELALQSLPGEKGGRNRPVTPQAKAALVQAMGYYRGYENNEEALQPQILMKMDNRSDVYEHYPENFLRINESETCMVSVDENDAVYVWNLSDGSRLQKWNREDLDAVVSEAADKVGEYYSSIDVKGVFFTDEETCLIVVEDSMIEADIQTGQLKVLWVDSDFDTGLYGGCRYIGTIDAVVVNHLEADEETDLYAAHVELWDVQNGKKTGSLNLRDCIDGEQQYTIRISSYCGMKTARDGNMIAIAAEQADKASSVEAESCLILWYPKEDRFTRINLGKGYVRDMQSVCNDDGMTALVVDSESMSLAREEPFHAKLNYINLESENCVWAADLNCSVPYGHCTGAISYSLNDKLYIFVWAGSMIFQFAQEDGTIIYQDYTAGTICGAEYSAGFKENGYLALCTEKGEILNCNLDYGGVTDPVAAVQMSVDRFIYHSDTNLALLVNAADGKIMLMRPVTDDRCEILKGEEYPNAFYYTNSDNCIIVGRGKAEDLVEYSLYRREKAGDISCLSEEPALVWEEQEIFGSKYVNRSTMFLSGIGTERGMNLTARSLKTGDIAWQAHLEGYMYAYPSGWDKLQCSDDGTVMLYQTDDGFALMSMENGETFSSVSGDDFSAWHDLGDYTYVSLHDPQLTPDGAYVLVCSNRYSDDGISDYTDLCLNLFRVEDSKWIDLPKHVTDISIKDDSIDSFRVTGDGTSVLIYSKKERALYAISLKDWKIRFKIPFTASESWYFSITEGDRFLFLWAEDGKMQVRDSKTGELISETQEYFGYVESVSYDEKEQLMEVKADRNGAESSLYYLQPDGELVLFRKRSNLFLMDGYLCGFDAANAEYRFYPIRTLDEMISEAEEYLRENA